MTTQSSTPQTTRPISGWAVTSLIFGILGIVCSWTTYGLASAVAVVTGHMGLGATKRGVRPGRGQAWAGLILGYLFGIPIVLTRVGQSGVLTDMGMLIALIVAAGLGLSVLVWEMKRQQS